MHPIYLLIGLVIIALIFLIVAIPEILRNPYHYPYHEILIDISRRRNVDYEEEIEQYLLDHGLSEFTEHLSVVDNWKIASRKDISRCKPWMQKLRRRQFEDTVDDSHMFKFIFARGYTRYKQINYIRHGFRSYHYLSQGYSYRSILELHKELKKIGFETTQRKYFAKNQRRLMTKELKEQIKKRDNYTCRLCGKYMPDEVGLHIDHIIPISKGGKSVASNLQVLCSVCNGKKSSHM